MGDAAEYDDLERYRERLRGMLEFKQPISQRRQNLLCNKLLMKLHEKTLEQINSDKTVDELINILQKYEHDFKYIVSVPRYKDSFLVAEYNAASDDEIGLAWKQIVEKGAIYDAKYPGGINPEPTRAYMANQMIITIEEQYSQQKFHKMHAAGEKVNIIEYDVPMSLLHVKLRAFIKETGINVFGTLIQHLILMGWPLISINTNDSAFDAIMMILLHKYGAVPPCERDEAFYENYDKYRAIPWTYAPLIHVMREKLASSEKLVSSYMSYIVQYPKTGEYCQLMLVCPIGLDDEIGIIRTYLPEHVLVVLDDIHTSDGEFGTPNFRKFLRLARIGAPINNDYYYQWVHAHNTGEQLYMPGSTDYTIMTMLVLRRLQMPKEWRNRGGEFLRKIKDAVSDGELI